MHPFQLAILAMAPTDWTGDESRHERRALTTDEPDLLANCGGRSPGLKGIKAAWAMAGRWRWRSRAGRRLGPTPLPAAEAPAAG